MELLRGGNRGSAIRGRSTHNQCIERCWIDVWGGVTNLYHDLFSFLENEHEVDIDNEVHMWALHNIYLPRINHDLQLFVQQWNNHPLRTEQNTSPLQLFVSEMLALQNSNLTAVKDMFAGDNDALQDTQMPANLDLENRIEVPNTPQPLGDDQM